MLYQKNNSEEYIKQFRKRFTNFCEKMPILVSFVTTNSGVQVIDETTNKVYDFDWDFSIPVKTFIYGIKNIFTEQCYPIIEKVEKTIQPISKERQIKLAETGIPFEKIPTSEEIETSTKYLIDKVLVVKDIFIIKNLESNKMFRYKMNKSSVFFLKKLRSGELNQVEAGKYFFDNSSFLNEIEHIED